MSIISNPFQFRNIFDISLMVETCSSKYSLSMKSENCGSFVLPLLYVLLINFDTFCSISNAFLKLANTSFLI